MEAKKQSSSIHFKGEFRNPTENQSQQEEYSPTILETQSTRTGQKHLQMADEDYTYAPEESLSVALKLVPMAKSSCIKTDSWDQASDESSLPDEDGNYSLASSYDAEVAHKHTPSSSPPPAKAINFLEKESSQEQDQNKPEGQQPTVSATTVKQKATAKFGALYSDIKNKTPSANKGKEFQFGKKSKDGMSALYGVTFGNGESVEKIKSKTKQKQIVSSTMTLGQISACKQNKKKKQKAGGFAFNQAVQKLNQGEESLQKNTELQIQENISSTSEQPMSSEVSNSDMIDKSMEDRSNDAQPYHLDSSMAQESVSRNESSASDNMSSQNFTRKSFRADTASNISAISGLTGINRSFYGGGQRRGQGDATDRSYLASDISALNMTGFSVANTSMNDDPEVLVISDNESADEKNQFDLVVEIEKKANNGILPAHKIVSDAIETPSKGPNKQGARSYLRPLKKIKSVGLHELNVKQLSSTMAIAPAGAEFQTPAGKSRNKRWNVTKALLDLNNGLKTPSQSSHNKIMFSPTSAKRKMGTMKGPIMEEQAEVALVNKHQLEKINENLGKLYSSLCDVDESVASDGDHSAYIEELKKQSYESTEKVLHPVEARKIVVSNAVIQKKQLRNVEVDLHNHGPAVPSYDNVSLPLGSGLGHRPRRQRANLFD